MSTALTACGSLPTRIYSPIETSSVSNNETTVDVKISKIHGEYNINNLIFNNKMLALSLEECNSKIEYQRNYDIVYNRLLSDAD